MGFIYCVRSSVKGFIMNVTPIVNNSVTPQNFKGNNERKTGGAGKGWASAAIPGLGQFIDGRIIAGVGFLGGSIGLLLAQKHYSKDAISIMKKEVELLAIESRLKTVILRNLAPAVP